MAKKPGYTPLIYTYLKKYQDDPNSRVFAPLAEAYRKAGLADEAIEIAREGLKFHPTFIGGRVALARALFDKKLYAEVVAELAMVVQEAPDNLVAQKLMAESCLILGQVTEALGAFKMLLYFNPTDPETARVVQELEGQAYQEGKLVLRTDVAQADELSSFQVRGIHQAIDEDPDRKKDRWITKVERLQRMLQRVERYRTNHQQL